MRSVRGAELFAAVVLIALLAQGATVLFEPPVRGMADNGDFWRVAVPAGLEPPDPLLRNRFVAPTYVRRPTNLREGFSSAALLAAGAAHLPSFEGSTVDLRQIGALYFALLVALFVWTITLGRSAIVCTLIAWVVMDPGYLLFFNSLYADATAILGLLVAVAALGSFAHAADGGTARTRLERGVAAGLVLFGIFLAIFSKQAHMLLGLPAALAVIGRPALRRTALGCVLALGCVIATAVSAYHFTVGPGHRFPATNDYHAVFRGIAEVSTHPDRTLRALGISVEHRTRIGHSYYEAPVPAGLTDELHGLSRLQLVQLYLQDPRALSHTLLRAQSNLAIQDRYLGNYPFEGDDAAPARVYDEPWAFTHLRPRFLGWPPLFFAICAALIVWLAWPRRGTDEASGENDALRARLSFLVWTIAMETPAAILGDGFFALWNHLTLARFGLDLAIALVIAELLTRLARRVGQRKEATEKVPNDRHTAGQGS